MKSTTLAAVFVCVLAALPARSAEAEKLSEVLSEDEVKALMTELRHAAETATTFRADIVREETSGFIMDAEPMVSRGSVAIRRPTEFRQEISLPRRSLTVVDGKNLWVHFPQDREAQHVEIGDGLPEKANVMAWLEFDHAKLIRRFQITARRLDPPEGLIVMRVPRREEGGVECESENGGAEKTADLPVPEAVPGAPVYEFTFIPRAPEHAPNLDRLQLTVYGGFPWPVRIEQESFDGDLIVTSFSNILLDAPLESGLFAFTPPRGTKVIEISR